MTDKPHETKEYEKVRKHFLKGHKLIDAYLRKTLGDEQYEELIKIIDLQNKLDKLIRQFADKYKKGSKVVVREVLRKIVHDHCDTGNVFIDYANTPTW